MRRPYEDPHQHFENYIGRSADRYADGLRRAGLRPNDKLTRAMADRAARAAREDYEQRANQVLEGNVRHILREYHERDRQLRREGARLAWMTCPLIALIFGVCAWFNFNQGDKSTGIIFMVAALAFLVMLVVAQARRP